MEKYIKQLLFEYDCVIVPGFGGFLTQYISAEIHPITHKFTPPAKRVAFNEQLKNNDGLLVTMVAAGENISREEAQNLVTEFTKDISNQLRRVNYFELPDIGRLFYNEHNQLEFAPDTTANYYEESFGLSELFFKPIERNTSTVNKPADSKRKVKSFAKKDSESKSSKSNIGLVVLSVLFIAITGATGFFYLNKDNQELASINPFVLLGNHEQTEVKSPKTKVQSVTPANDKVEAPVIEEIVAEEDAVVVEEPEVKADIIMTPTQRFFIVAGSFKSKENAMKLKEKFDSENQEVSIIEPTNDKELYRVSIADFDNKELASSKMQELKDSKGYALWLLKQ